MRDRGASVHSHKTVMLTGVLRFVACFCALHAWVRIYALGVDVGTLIGLQGATFTGDAIFRVRAVPFPPMY